LYLKIHLSHIVHFNSRKKDALKLNLKIYFRSQSQGSVNKAPRMATGAAGQSLRNLAGPTQNSRGDFGEPGKGQTSQARKQASELAQNCRSFLLALAGGLLRNTGKLKLVT
jgi:hypothetical protein